MKMTYLVTGTLACAALLTLSACKKEQPAADSQAPQTAESGGKSLSNAIAPLAATAQQVADKAVEQAQVAQQAANKAVEQAKAAQQNVQAFIDRAKTLVSENNYQAALTNLVQLQNFQLTPDQQKLVDDLKAKIQAALAKVASTNAASAIGNALGGMLGGKK